MTTTPTHRVTARDIRPVVTALAKVVGREKNSRGAFPLLRLEAVDRKLIRFTVTDGATFLSIDLPGEVHPSIAPKSIHYLPLADLRDALRGCKAEESVALHASPDPGEKPFPEEPCLRSKPITLESDVLLALQQALECSSPDPTRYTLQSACLDPEGRDRIRMIGTDGRHLFQSRPFRLPGIRERVLIPSLPVLDCPLLRKETRWQLQLNTGRENGKAPLFRLTGSSWQLTAPLIEGNYPNYNQVIPSQTEVRSHWQIAAEHGEKLAKILTQTTAQKSRDHPVGLSRTGEALSVLFRRRNRIDYDEVRLSLKETVGKDAAVYLNPLYFSRALRFGLRQFEIVDENRPVLVSGSTGKLVIMPVRAPGTIPIGHSEDWGHCVEIEGKVPARKSPPRTTRPRKEPAQRPTSVTSLSPARRDPHPARLGDRFVRWSVRLGLATFGWLPSR